MNTMLTTDEWEKLVGANVRQARFQANLSMRELAALADVSLGALNNLESGSGTTLRTLVRVVRALDRADWLLALAPEVGVSPMQMLRERQRNTPQRRVRRSGN